MIKEKVKKKIKEKTLGEIISEFIRTILYSFLAAFIFTIFLTIDARNEMIKNIYASVEERQKLDEQIAKKLVSESDLASSLTTKNYAICMQVGNLYETAKDYEHAQYAYEEAIKKAKPGIYTHYFKLARVLIAQEKFDEAEKLIVSVTDIKNKKLIKFKTRAYIEMGDKYYSLGKFLKAAKNYEKAEYYYNRFSKRDKLIDESIRKRIVLSYTEAATIVVKQGFNSDAVRFLKKAEEFDPENFHIKYKLAIIYADLDPIMAIEYFEPLLKKMPQYIDYDTYNKALLKAATISDLEGNAIKAKQYRYRSHSIDLMINNKVVYKNDLEVLLESFKIRKVLFKYHLNGSYIFRNVSSSEIYNLYADFVLKNGDKEKETVTVQCVSKRDPLMSNGGETDPVTVNFKKTNILTQKELKNYKIEVYVYKDKKYKTFVASFDVPLNGVKKNKIEEDIDSILGN